ncbi:MAG: hypothetical protein ABI865_11955, partial [Nitrosospira sp.]
MKHAPSPSLAFYAGATAYFDPLPDVPDIDTTRGHRFCATVGSPALGLPRDNAWALFIHTCREVGISGEKNT